MAQDHANDMAKNNFFGHSGSDGSSMTDRLYRRCSKPSGPTAMAENIGGDFAYKGRNHALNTVKSLLIDDGVKSRGHRKAVLSTAYEYIGVGSAMVGKKIKVVIDYFNQNPVLKDGSQKEVKVPKQKIDY